MDFFHRSARGLRACALAAAVCALPALGQGGELASAVSAQELYEQANRYRDGEGVAMDRRRAAELYAKAASDGHAASDYELARFHTGMAGERVDLDQARKHLVRAARRGHAQAQVELAFMYFNGTLAVPRDLVAARGWFEKAAGQGVVVAQCLLGDIYRDGLGGPHNRAQALRWYRLTAQTSDACAPKSQYELYVSYASGLGVPRDVAQAMQWLQRSAQSGSPLAQRALGLAYRDGQGVRRDPQLAQMWLLKSREGVAPHDDHEHEDAPADERHRHAH